MQPRRAIWTLPAFLLIALFVPGATAADPVAGIPPDGPAGPVYSMSALHSSAPLNTEVTTQLLTVSSVSCPNCASATTAADFWVKDSTGSMRVHVQNTWQATYNVKKQNFVPAVGQRVVVQGRLQSDSSGRFIEMKRFGEHDHAGPTAHAYDIAAGHYATGAWVWMAPAKVLNVAHWDDGDYTWDLRDPNGGGLVHVELGPPFQDQIRIPNLGETVQPYGTVRFDPDHNWWEIHSVRCWAPSTTCVPDAASYVRNGPPSTANGYTQGGAVPIWVPMTTGGTGGGTSGSGTLTATFHPSGNSNEWWIQVTVTAAKPLSGVQASVNSGSWIPLDHASWGDWVKSIHAPTGSSVRFQAIATDGTSKISPGVTWPPGPQPPYVDPPPLFADFKPVSTDPGTGMVQVVVHPSRSLGTMWVQSNYEPWHPMTLQADGTWSAKLDPPDAARIVFRAIAPDGEPAYSYPFAWPFMDD